ncbi:MAG TPA: beta-ketoacyl-[acyl-carrier-protein] synthase II [Prolixibacteraceae bacterium]|nr:beta-ketoacyl-[acyl-carrier-protein] synthase II [Prolixibacteraceae bacterium]
MNMKRVVITGLGAITPVGNSVPEYWNSLIHGKSGSAQISRFDASALKTRFACEVKNFDPLLYMEKQEARKNDLFSQYALAATQECVINSEINFEQVDRRRCGVIWATGIGGIGSFEKEIYEYFMAGEKNRISPFFITKMIPNMASGLISIKYGLHGASYATVSACSSSNHAITDSYNLITLGKADVMLAGGSEAPITRSTVSGFSVMRALSERNDTPESASRPFDETRDGFVLGEGAGVLMLEELEHAKRRGATIYAEMTGYGLASDAYHITRSHPEGLGGQLAMTEAMRDGGLKPEDIDYINTHATSTPVGDISEARAIAAIFNDCLAHVAVGATKSMTGHLLGAAGAIEASCCVLAVKNDMIPPTINLQTIDPSIDPRLNIFRPEAQKQTVRAALNNSFGFGGHIVSTLFQKFVE